MDLDSQERNRPSNSDRTGDPGGGRIRRGETGPAADAATPRPRGEGSLYEATLKERHSSWVLNLVWVVIAGSILAGLATFFWGSNPDPQVLEQAQLPPRQADGPSLTEQLLSEIRSGRRSADASAIEEADSTTDAGDPVPGTSGEGARAAASRPAAGLSANPPEPAQAASMEPPARTVRPPQADSVAKPAEQGGPPPVPPPHASGRSPAATLVTLPPGNAAAAPPATRATEAKEQAETVEGTRAAAGENPPLPAGIPPQAPEKSPHSARLDAALRVLERESSVASRLLAGNLSTLELRDHRIVHETAREVWVDLVAKWRNADAEIHLIWAVDLEREAVRPLSSEARRLEEASRSS
ncbi:MAG: hypothetical protein Kow00109_02300 [Acidobacteriota bacterium]